jgi:predicted unusual protein kinase regulating ubiquinone biosynthesis (AarF/ABC1/UbiB family)
MQLVDAKDLVLGLIRAELPPAPGLLADGTLAQIDFGSVVQLHATQRLALARVLMAISRQDPDLLRDSS